MSQIYPSGLKGIKKIAVLRANALGDLIFVLPAIRALKETYPEAELIYLGNLWHKTFLEGRPGWIDKVYVVPKWNGIPHESDKVEDMREADSFFNRMQEEKIDIAFQMHGGGRNSNPFVLNLGAKLTVGLQTKDAPPLDINIPYYLYQNEIFRYLEVVSKVGAKTAHLSPELMVTHADTDALFSKTGDLKRPFIILHPGSSDIRRRWPVENFAEVGNHLASKGFFIYITGTVKEIDLTEKLNELLDFKGSNLTNKITVNELLALCSKAALIISNDTGPLHLSRAVNTANIGIYWGANLVTAGPVKMENAVTCSDWSINCPLCGVDCTIENFNMLQCTHDTSFINRVTVDEVKKHAEFLLMESEKKLMIC